MPVATYKDLLDEVQPSVIETDTQYAAIGKRLGDLVGKGRARTREETKLMGLLLVLVQDYDRRHAFPTEKRTPAERLRDLLEESQKSPNALLPIFGQRSHVNEALTGKRPVSLAQARKLGAMFHLNPSYFL